ncbi:hypothetical protein MMC20_001955 [Loxospora ochrophaea]|nr:hypothetical protein [Loxospora ochrophaea]
MTNIVRVMHGPSASRVDTLGRTLHVVTYNVAKVFYLMQHRRTPEEFHVPIMGIIGGDFNVVQVTYLNANYIEIGPWIPWENVLMYLPYYQVSEWEEATSYTKEDVTLIINSHPLPMTKYLMRNIKQVVYTLNIMTE